MALLYRLLLWAFIIFGALFTYFGTWLTIKAGDAEADYWKQQFRHTDEQFQKLFIALNTANHEDAKKITEEKIRLIHNDFIHNATDFATTFLSAKREYDKARADSLDRKVQAELRKENMLSGQTFPVLTFATRYLEESAKAFINVLGTNIHIDQIDFPVNAYQRSGDSPAAILTTYDITTQWNITGKGRWEINLCAHRPADESNPPMLWIHFYDSQGNRTGSINLRVFPARQKMLIEYTNFSESKTPEIHEEYGLSNYERIIQEIFPKVIKSQLFLM